MYFGSIVTAEAAVTPHKSSSQYYANENVVVYTLTNTHMCKECKHLSARYADAMCNGTRDVQLNDEINVKEIHLTYCAVLVGR